jgi:hypothetical protein
MSANNNYGPQLPFANHQHESRVIARLSCLREIHSPEIKMVYANIRAIGVERTAQATDLGQKTNPPVAEG